jgi:hypothetical protein
MGGGGLSSFAPPFQGHIGDGYLSKVTVSPIDVVFVGLVAFALAGDVRWVLRVKKSATRLTEGRILGRVCEVVIVWEPWVPPRVLEGHLLIKNQTKRRRHGSGWLSTGGRVGPIGR